MRYLRTRRTNTGKRILSSKTDTASSLKLQIQLIPKPLSKRNLRSSEGLGKERWEKLRRQLIKERGACCEICGATGQRLDAHEVWDYREKDGRDSSTSESRDRVC